MPTSMITGDFAIPTDIGDISQGGSLSFILPLYSLNENNLKIEILNENNITIVSTEFMKCCAKIMNTVTGYFDKFTYPSNWELITSMNLTMAWTTTMIYLIVSSTLVPLAGVITSRDTLPSKARLMDSNEKLISTTWKFDPYFSNIVSNSCAVSNSGDKCKSGKLSLSKSLQPESNYIRYSFISPPDYYFPITISVYSSESLLASISFYKSSIELKSASKTITVTIATPVEEGQWIAGDIFTLSKETYKYLKENSSTYNCLFVVSSSCFTSQAAQDWKMQDEKMDILRYAYIKGTEYRTINSYIDSGTGEVVKSTEESFDSDEVYLHLSYSNNIVGGISIPSTSITELKITGTQNLVPICFWRFSVGTTPSINISASTLSGLLSQIKMS